MGAGQDLHAFDEAESPSTAERLLQLTGAIAAAVGPHELYQALVEETGRALQAVDGALWLADGDGVVLARSFGHPLTGLDTMEGGAPRWITSPRGDGHQIACLPLRLGGRTLGTLAFGFDGRHALDEEKRALLLLVARYGAQALERLRLLEAEREGEDVVRELAEAIRFNDLFVGVLAHDLRNPLVAMVSAAQMALARAHDGKLDQSLRRIIGTGERMTRMIGQLLDFTRVRVGTGMVLSREEVDLALLLEQLLDEYDYIRPGFKPELEFTGMTRGMWDRDRLYQVFANLIANAAQHGQGGVRVHLDGTRSVTRVDVHNQGAVPRELLPHLFEPMAGLKHGRRAPEGLGLGLFITDQIVRAHGGSVEVRASDAEGTTFTVHLPRG
jgi:signal transduction histidine kinase